MSSSLIKSLMTETVEIVRSSSIDWSNGNPVRGPESVIKTAASIQPLTPNEILQLPEHRRTKESVKMYLAIKVATSDEKNQLPADRIKHEGKLYEVHGVENWAIGTDLPHFKAICVKIDGEGGGNAP